MKKFSDLMGKQTLLPIVFADTVEQGVNVTKAMEQAGLNLIEVVLRTPASLDALSAIKKACPNMVVGAGTVYTTDILHNAICAGADYIVTPATTPKLLEALIETQITFLPGVSTTGDVACMLELGVNEMKLFPAELSGGVRFLKALSSVFQPASFCPTGGVHEGNAEQYLALPNVFAVGGTWVAPKEWVDSGNWGQITLACSAAVA